MSVAETILTQLGGNKFVVMTGSKNFFATSDGLGMKLTKNLSGANRLQISLKVDDTYTMRFFKFTQGRLNKTTYVFSDDKIKEVETIQGVYFDMLQPIFTRVTGLDTHL